jgi:hypothetical protein
MMRVVVIARLGGKRRNCGQYGGGYRLPKKPRLRDRPHDSSIHIDSAVGTVAEYERGASICTMAAS